ncbi:PAS domain S-box-containing protein [Azospirillum fermentarium]|uniref:PAS domain-containing protein n=1 Tax=Azospirillum fermentarium TaxID=1233114 RepID=UPI002227A8B1|nr:PAS domain-containing protein [Azospirillum fermentarium]MCW2244524.1 PAS domain S-box-containing protein [Azospirillum fermentarium]
MMESTAPDIFAADAANAQRVALWWRGLVMGFTAAVLLTGLALGFLTVMLESRLTAIADTARERAVIEETADLAARLTDTVSIERRRAVRQILEGQIGVLERIRGQNALSDDAAPAYQTAWDAPDGALYRYVQALRTMVGENTGLMPVLTATPDEIFAVIDQSLVLQNQRVRTRMLMTVAGIAAILGLAVAAGLLSLPLGLRPALAGLRRARRAVGAPQPAALPAAPAVPADMVARALDQCQSMVVITSSTGIIEYVNTRFLAHNGYATGDVVGQPVRILSAGVFPCGYRTAWETLMDGKVWSGNLCNRRRDGSCYWSYATVTPVRDGTGRVVRFIAVEQDMSQCSAVPCGHPHHAAGGARGETELRNGAALQ